jgi:hypothetical protein
MGEREEEYIVLVEGSKESSQLVKPRRRWEDNIKMGLQVMEWRGPDWIALVPDLAGGWRL